MNMIILEKDMTYEAWIKFLNNSGINRGTSDSIVNDMHERYNTSMIFNEKTSEWSLIFPSVEERFKFMLVWC